MKMNLVFALILSACVTEPLDESLPEASLDAVLDGERPKTCTSTVRNQCGPRPDRNLMQDWQHAQCGERPEYKPTAEWADSIDRWAKCVAEFLPVERWTHDIDLWAKCADAAQPSLVQ